MKQSFWDSGPEDATPVDEQDSCELFGMLGILMQFFLGLCAFLSLVLKRHYEVPKRSGRIFFLDISKQAGSAAWQHLMNTVAAVYLQEQSNKGDGCDWYFLNFSTDFIFVMGISYGIHRLVVMWAEKNDILTLQAGVYLSIHDAQYIYLYSYEDLDKHINYKVWAI